MSEPIPKSVLRSEFRVAGVDIVVHLLNDGRRIIESASMHALLAKMEDGSLSAKDAQQIVDNVRSGSAQP